jgi:D-3-phosphoglycerate dehydrogenase
LSPISLANAAAAGDLGYVVLDADLGGQDSGELLQQIRSLEGTVGARLVFEH